MKKFMIVSFTALSLAGAVYAGDGSCKADKKGKDCSGCEKVEDSKCTTSADKK